MTTDNSTKVSTEIENIKLRLQSLEEEKSRLLSRKAELEATTPELADRSSTLSTKEKSAGIFETSINSRYQFSRDVGLLLGITYFDAAIDVEDDDRVTEVSYGYSGAFLGLHFSL